MSEAKACSAYRHAEQLCSNGFFQLTGFCSGKLPGCPTCGHVSDRMVPDCLRETPRYRTPATIAALKGPSHE